MADMEDDKFRGALAAVVERHDKTLAKLDDKPREHEWRTDRTPSGATEIYCVVCGDTQGAAARHCPGPIQ